MNARESTLPATTTPGAVRLVVADLDGERRFYERALGLEAREPSPDLVRLGVGDTALIELAHRPQAPARPHGTTGLFHLAILVPDRSAVATALRRMAESGSRLTGASDHLVSEAIYLRDPEGNGIEIYRDRPREQWARANGELRMDSLPLDLEDLLSEPDHEGPERMAEGTRIGHIHLNVSDLAASEDFYGGLLGLDVTVRSYPGALFFAAGAYHHHVGLNTWGGEGASAPPPGSRGLQRFELIVPQAADVEAAAERLRSGGIEVERADRGIAFSDPSGNEILLADGADV